MEKITLDQAEDILRNDFFIKGPKKKFIFLPDALCDWAVAAGFSYHIEPIRDWESFEYGRVDFDIKDFKKFILGTGDKEDDVIIVITDGFIADKTARRLLIRDLHLLERFYGDVLKMAFFQPNDHIVILPEAKKIRIIHHEGMIIRIQKEM